MTMLLEASEEGIGESYDRDSGRIVWTVRYTLEGEEENGSQVTDVDQSQRMQQRQLQHHHHHRVDKKKVQVRLEIQKDDIQAVLPISKVTIRFSQRPNANSVWLNAQSDWKQTFVLQEDIISAKFSDNFVLSQDSGLSELMMTIKNRIYFQSPCIHMYRRVA